jgi:hypothetical protein
MLIPLSLPPGINSDDSTFAAEGRWADGDGFRFRMGKPETVGGAFEMTNSTSMVRVNKMLVYDAAGTISLAAAGTTLRVGAPDAAGTDITPASGWTTTVGTRRCLAMWGDTLLASVSGGKLFESSGGLQATEITNAPDAITCMVVTPSRQVMALGCNEEVSGTFNGRCIRWSDIEDNTDWTTTSTNNAGEYILPGQADIISGCILGDNVLIWTEAALWLGQFVGDPLQSFIFTRVASASIAGLDAFAIHGQTVYWMSSDRGVYAYQVGALAQRIPCPMSNEFPPDSAENASIFGCAVTRYGEIWFGVAVGASSPNRYYVYCVDESAAAQAPVWFRGTFSLGGFSLGTAMVDSPLLVDTLAGYRTTTIVHDSAKPWRWDCGKTNTIAAPPGLSGAYIQSADFYVDKSERRMMLRNIIPDFDEQTGAVYLTVYARDRPMAEPVTKGPYTVATSTALAACLVNDTVASGDSVVTVDTGPEAMAAGVKFTFAGVNGYSGGDTGSLAQFTVSSAAMATSTSRPRSSAVASAGTSSPCPRTTRSSTASPGPARRTSAPPAR